MEAIRCGTKAETIKMEKANLPVKQLLTVILTSIYMSISIFVQKCSKKMIQNQFQEEEAQTVHA